MPEAMLDYTEEQAMSHRTCSIEGCDRKHSGRGWCHKHYMQWYSTGDPIAKRAWHPTGAEHPLWTGADASYSTAHKRIAYRRGRAADHLCAHQCGRQARDWAYDHSDPAELTDILRNIKGTLVSVTFSSDPGHYLPLCKSCHVAFDRRKEEDD